MGTVRISFLGVCTIFRDLSNLAQPANLPSGIDIPPNRVVLPRTTDSFMRATGVDPHIAQMQILAGKIALDGPPLPPAVGTRPNTCLLDGVGLRIINATDTAVMPDEGLRCLPSLSAFLDGTLGPPAPYVYVRSSGNVQAWFDVPGGEWLAYLLNPNPPCQTVPSISVLTMQTEGDPILEYVPWDGAAQPTRVTLQSSQSQPMPEITVMNFAFGEAVIDDNRDFLLNYTLAETFPPTSGIRIPAANACTIQSPVVFPMSRCGDAGPGCSNTNYP